MIVRTMNPTTFPTLVAEGGPSSVLNSIRMQLTIRTVSVPRPPARRATRSL